MAKKGQSIYWTEKRISALMKLAKIAEQNLARGKLNWEYASVKNPAQRNILKERSNAQLSKAYSRYSRVAEGKCYTSGCKNKRDTIALNCKACRARMKNYAKKYKSKWDYSDFLENYRDQAIEHIKKNTKEGLVSFILEEMNNMTIEARKAVLTTDFQKEILKRWGKVKRNK